MPIDAQGGQGGVGFPGTRITGLCELSDMGAGAKPGFSAKVVVVEYYFD